MEFNSANFIESLLLMGIGLLTVFSVLLLIICLGNLLVKLVNKYAPEEEKVVATEKSNNAVDANVVQAINLAISQLTNGKSKAEKIERI